MYLVLNYAQCVITEMLSKCHCVCLIIIMGPDQSYNILRPVGLKLQRLNDFFFKLLLIVTLSEISVGEGGVTSPFEGTPVVDHR